MKSFILLMAFLFASVPYGDFREYHYNAPQIPFQQPQSSPQIAPRYQNFAASNANTFNQNQNFARPGTGQIGRQYVTPNSNGYQAPQQYTPVTNQGSYNQANNGGYFNGASGGVGGGGVSNYASSIAASYHPQQQYTSNVNPLTQQSQYQQQQRPGYVNLPQAGPYNTQNYANSQQQVATGFNNNGFGQQGHGQGIRHGQGQGHGRGHGQGGQTLPLNGNFVSQSEAGQLHSYQHQQQPVGNTQPFTRQITTCYPNGQCEQKTLSVGQVDTHHQQTVTKTRAKTVPRVDKCRQIADAKKAGGASYAGGSYSGGSNNAGFQNVDSYSTPPDSSQGQYGVSGSYGVVRPKDRRLFPYSETVSQDFYN